MIQVENLTKHYGTTAAIRDVSFEVAKGEVLGFLGPNGAGKTTTMRILCGCIGATSGQARVGGEDVQEHPRQVKARIGYLPEHPPLYPSMVVEDYVRFAGTIKGVRDASAATDRVLSRVGLLDVRQRLIEHLSKGYRQRVGLAQALIHDPSVLVLDEPSSGLDPAQRLEMLELIRELADGDRTVILSTHILPEVERVCDRVVVIHQGQVLHQGSLDEWAQSSLRTLVRVETIDPCTLDALQGLDGVSSVRREDDHFVVTSTRDLRTKIAATMVSYGLQELRPVAGLEEIYLRLTTQNAREESLEGAGEEARNEPESEESSQDAPEVVP
jgi:ABC-2 type transport system ATP-binding protein